MFSISIGLMLTVESRLFFYKNIARHLLRKFAVNVTNIKLIFSGDFLLIWEYLYFVKLITHINFLIWSKNTRMIFRVKRELIARRRMKKKSINIVHFLIFVDKFWFKVTNLFVFLFMCIFKWGLAANECYESSKLTKKLVDSSA